MLQAHQALNVLRAVRDLPSLESIFTAEFRPAEYSEDTVLVPALVEENLLGIAQPIKARAYFGRVKGGNARSRTCRHSTSNPDNGQDSTCDRKIRPRKTFKSKNARWEEANTLSNLKKKN